MEHVGRTPRPIVYVLTMVGVYDQGCAGVFTTFDAAHAHALELDAQSDGYHSWRIEEMLLDEPQEVSGLTLWSTAETLGTGRPEAITFAPLIGPPQ